MKETKVQLTENSQLVFIKAEFGEEFSQIEDTHYFYALKKSCHSYSLSIAMAFYGHPSMYSESKEENKEIHLPGLDRQDYIKLYQTIFVKYFWTTFKRSVSQVAIGHHHSKEAKKCFLQIIITFPEPFTKTIPPNYVKIIDPSKPNLKNKIFLFMKQKSKNSTSSCRYMITQGPLYLLKSTDGEFIYKIKNADQKDDNEKMYVSTSSSVKRKDDDEDDDDDDNTDISKIKITCETKKKKKKTEKKDSSEKEVSVENEMSQSRSKKEKKKSSKEPSEDDGSSDDNEKNIHNTTLESLKKKKIEKGAVDIREEKNVKSIEELFFTYDKTGDWNINEEIFDKYPLIKKWFSIFAEPKGLRIRRALLLFSEDESGKKDFAENLLKERSLFVMFQGKLANKSINQNIKLVILNEFTDFEERNKEAWINIFSGKRASFKDENGDIFFEWRYNVPCIILTSSIFVLKKLFLNSEYQKIIFFQEMNSLPKPSNKEDQSEKENPKKEKSEVSASPPIEAAFSDSIFEDMEERDKMLGKKTKKEKCN